MEVSIPGKYKIAGVEVEGTDIAFLSYCDNMVTISHPATQVHVSQHNDHNITEHRVFSSIPSHPNPTPASTLPNVHTTPASAYARPSPPHICRSLIAPSLSHFYTLNFKTPKLPSHACTMQPSRSRRTLALVAWGYCRVGCENVCLLFRGGGWLEAMHVRREGDVLG